MLLAKIRQFIGRHHLLQPDDKVLVAYSGGADSTCLLLALKQIHGNVEAVYVNHQLRGTESNEEEQFVRKFCEKKGIPLHVETIKWYRAPSDLEQAARRRRYRHLAKVALELGVQKVAIAHHADDVAETFLLNLFRGSGPSGLEGIRPQRGIYIRPMLQCTRKDVLAFLKSGRVKYFTDSSNMNLSHRRNRVRKELIPYIQQHFNAAFPQAIVRTSRWIAAQNQLLTELLEPYGNLLQQVQGEWRMDRLQWLQLPSGLQKALLKMFLHTIDPDLKVGSRNLGAFMKAIQDSKQLELPGYLQVHTTERFVRFLRKKSRIGPAEVDVPGPGNYRFPVGDATLAFAVTSMNHYHPGKNVAYLDADKASFPLYIRNWKKGDTFQPLGMSGRKKLSDFWIDKKVPRENRKKIPLVFKDDDLIWLGGHQIHNNYKITPSTSRLLRIELKQNA